MWMQRFLGMSQCLKKRPSIVASCVLILTVYYLSEKYLIVEELLPFKLNDTRDDEIVDGYEVWNSRCRIISYNPMDSSIRQFVKKKSFENCSTSPHLTSIVKGINDTFVLTINIEVAKNYDRFNCCWSSISRINSSEPLTNDSDTKISLSPCESFKNEAVLPSDIEFVLVTCKSKNKYKKQKKNYVIYENIHAIVNPKKVQDRYIPRTDVPENNNMSRKMSILVLGIDSVSRLNFLRSLPETEKYLRKSEWVDLRGYNKMGDNTFPNLMAILTGQNNTSSYDNCKPKQAYGLDNCSFIWHSFKKAGYITAYGEDVVSLSTFNYLKAGFIAPPTDYYLRPYMLATEKYLKSKNKFDAKYCTGPELAVDRIFDYALKFSKIFIDSPYFGFFWTNTVSHNDVNGISSMDEYLLNKLIEFEKVDAFRNTLVIFLSDHGMRWGDIRHTNIGWYEERLPFIYLRIPIWLKRNSEISQALKNNEHKLTSPYDIYETFRHVLRHAGGDAPPSSGCPTCRSLFESIPADRGCKNAGISPHWCTCTDFLPINRDSEVAKKGAQIFLNYVESVVKNFKDHTGHRLCATLKLKKIHRVNKIINFDNMTLTDDETTEKYFFLFELTPGGGLFETTIQVEANGHASMAEEEVSRINSYAKDAKCLENGMKKYCYCLKR